METVINVLISIVMLIVVTWIAIFGGIGALLSRSRGGSAAIGLAWGTMLGPIGWLSILWTTRKPKPPPAQGIPQISSIQHTSNSPAHRSTAEDRWDPWND